MFKAVAVNNQFELKYVFVVLQEMTSGEKNIIKDLGKCDFTDVFEHFQRKSEERKGRSKEEKQVNCQVLLFFTSTGGQTVLCRVFQKKSLCKVVDFKLI